LVQTLAAKSDPEKQRDAYHLEMKRPMEAKARAEKLAILPYRILARSADLTAALNKGIEAKPEDSQGRSGRTPSRTRKASWISARVARS
jgi:non-homologous end joining protein Ku